MKITNDQIAHLAHLSRLKLNDEEIASMQKDMTKILDFVATIEELNLEGVEALTQMSPSVDVMREDAVGEMLTKEQALKNAPDANSDYFRVPKFGKKA